MSSPNELINIWVPATVVALAISILAAYIWNCIWDLCRRRFWTFWARFFPCITREVRLDQDILNLLNNIVSNLPNRNVVEQGYLEVNQNIEESMRSPIVIEELRSSGSVEPGHNISNEEPASSSKVNTICPTHETIEMVGTHHDTEGRVSVSEGLVKSPDIVQPGGQSSINEEPASSSNVNTIGPTQDEIIEISETHHDIEGRVSLMDSTSQYVEDNIIFENSNTFGHDVTLRSCNIESNLEHLDTAPSTQSYNEEASTSGSSGFTSNNPSEPDNFPCAHMDSTPSSNSSSSVFMATLYLAGSLSMSSVSYVKEQLQNLADHPIWQWKSSVVLQGRLSTDPVVLAKAVKLLKDCVKVDKSCTLQLGTWGILYFKGTSFTNFTLTFKVLYYL